MISLKEGDLLATDSFGMVIVTEVKKELYYGYVCMYSPAERCMITFSHQNVEGWIESTASKWRKIS